MKQKNFVVMSDAEDFGRLICVPTVRSNVGQGEEGILIRRHHGFDGRLKKSISIVTLDGLVVGALLDAAAFDVLCRELADIIEAETGQKRPSNDRA